MCDTDAFAVTQTWGEWIIRHFVSLFGSSIRFPLLLRSLCLHSGLTAGGLQCNGRLHSCVASVKKMVGSRVESLGCSEVPISKGCGGGKLAVVVASCLRFVFSPNSVWL